ncbi:MAG: ATP-dependent DNA ligase [Verrucomicrobiae bacterium]|nr:ATP-dependent DNA ligase [Verrucomicrobiae bacterium]
MRAFAQLFVGLDRTPRTTEKLAALERYFRDTPPADAAWALWFLSGQRLKRAIPISLLREWTAATAGLPAWLVEESHEHVGDLAETLALLLPPNPAPNPPPLASLVENHLLPLAGATPAAQRALVLETWSLLDTPQRFLWHKLITGSFRVGVARTLLVRALARLAGVDPPVMDHRLLGHWHPTASDFAQLLSDARPDDPARPYPFFLASPLDADPASLGAVSDWQIEWKWDGIRAQLIRRAGQAVLWSRGGEIVSASFPEILDAARQIPDGTVLDGELLAWRDAGPLPFAALQRRLHRRRPSPALQREIPAAFMAYDLLEHSGSDLRHHPLSERRRSLESILATARPSPAQTPGSLPLNDGPWFQPELIPDPNAPPPPPFPLRLAPPLSANSWNHVAALRDAARLASAEGLMLKRLDSPYGTGRPRGAWWKWKVSPFTCDAVLVAAQPGHGRRATLFTDYTFAVWRDDELVPVAKACSGLTDAEIDAVDAFVRAHTTGRFGPVRSVTPELVFELAFEGIAPSSRHKSGIALRFPRIARWRTDKRPADADTLEPLLRLATPHQAATVQD